jgi:hypothetical protein
LQVETKKITTTDEIAELYQCYSGAMGDLKQNLSLPTSYIDHWDKTTQAVLLVLVLAQPTTSAAMPWNLVPISKQTARQVINKINPDCSAEIELQCMCDMYLLERDNLDQYHIVYPEAIRHCDPSGDNILPECARQAVVLSPLSPSLHSVSPDICIYAIADMFL